MNNSPFLIFSKSWIQNHSAKTAFGKFKASVIALFIGVILSILIMSCLGSNGFDAFTKMFKTAFDVKRGLQKSLSLSALLVVVAIANAIAFKTGLFNIGVAGQMFFSTSLTFLLARTAFKNEASTLDGGTLSVIVLIFFAMVVGAIVAGFAGFLKAKFNVHEVVTTIILNWGLFYLAKWILNSVKGIVDHHKQATNLPSTMNLQANQSIGYIMIIFAIIISLFIAFLFWKTTFGFKMKAAGLNADAIEYAGINKRRQIIFAMACSGAVAGIAGWMSVFVIDKSIDLTASVYPTYGFDGIAISLIAFNNFLGIIPISIFFGSIRFGAPSLSIYGLDSSVASLMTGIIMYMAAISVVFIRFRIIKMCYIWFTRLRSSGYRLIVEQYQRDYSKQKLIVDRYEIEAQPQVFSLKQETTDKIIEIKKQNINITLKWFKVFKRVLCLIEISKQVNVAKKELKVKIHQVLKDNEHHILLKTIHTDFLSARKLYLSNIALDYEKFNSRYDELVKTEAFGKMLEGYKATLKKNRKLKFEIFKRTILKGKFSNYTQEVQSINVSNKTLKNNFVKFSETELGKDGV